MAALRPDLAWSLDEIRLAVGMIALLHSGNQLTAADMRAATALIDDEIGALQLALTDAKPAPTKVDLPIMTLAEVAARSQFRARPDLRVVESGGDAA